jgi:hypothetical protein
MRQVNEMVNPLSNPQILAQMNYVIPVIGYYGIINTSAIFCIYEDNLLSVPFKYHYGYKKFTTMIQLSNFLIKIHNRDDIYPTKPIKNEGI